MRIVFVASVILICGGCQRRMTKLNLNTTLNFIPSPEQQTFPQSQLSVQTLMVQLYALTSTPTLKIPSIGSHTTVWTPECSTHFVHPQAWNVAAIAAVELKTHMQFISCKGDLRPIQKRGTPTKTTVPCCVDFFCDGICYPVTPRNWKASLASAHLWSFHRASMWRR